MGANRNSHTFFHPSRQSLADGGMGANRNPHVVKQRVADSLADGGMGANRNCSQCGAEIGRA